MKTLFKILANTFSVCLFLGASYCAAASEEEILEYQRIFESASVSEQVKKCNELQWLGSSDERIFDPIEKRVLEMYPNTLSKRNMDVLSWYLKALGFSGNPKYKPTIERVLASKQVKKVNRYAKEALVYIEQYKEWNPIIADTSNFKDELTPRQNRLVNMLNSGSNDLVRNGAKRIHYDHIHIEPMLDAAMKVLAERATRKHEDKLDLDASKWIVRAVAGSGIPEYRERLEATASATKSSSLSRYVDKMIKRYY